MNGNDRRSDGDGDNDLALRLLPVPAGFGVGRVWTENAHARHEMQRTRKGRRGHRR